MTKHRVERGIDRRSARRPVCRELVAAPAVGAVLNKRTRQDIVSPAVGNRNDGHCGTPRRAKHQCEHDNYGGDLQKFLVRLNHHFELQFIEIRENKPVGRLFNSGEAFRRQQFSTIQEREKLC